VLRQELQLLQRRQLRQHRQRADGLLLIRRIGLLLVLLSGTGQQAFADPLSSCKEGAGKVDPDTGGALRTWLCSDGSRLLLVEVAAAFPAAFVEKKLSDFAERAEGSGRAGLKRQRFELVVGRRQCPAMRMENEGTGKVALMAIVNVAKDRTRIVATSTTREEETNGLAAFVQLIDHGAPAPAKPISEGR
jgi:hypothetical protein